MNNDLPNRKHPMHGLLFVDGQPTVVFDTVCTKDRQPWLDCAGVHKLLRQVWQDARAWLVGRYVIMPDHVHFFAVGSETDISYENWVSYWKSQFSKHHVNREHRWQTDHWDTRMRNAGVYEEKWEYVRWNPVRHGLVEKPDDWPYQGDVHQWRWD